MKVAHLNPELEISSDPFDRALLYEQQEEWKKAIDIYEKILQKSPVNDKALQRLMINYRKQKDPAKEIKVIDRAITAFETLTKSHSRHSGNRKIIKLSRSILKSVGQMDIEPIATWKKRRNMAENLLKKSRKKSK